MGKITEKSTKAQIMDAYTQALAELEKLKAMSDSPVENAKKEALEASMQNAEVAASNEVFSDTIVKQYNDLKIAIDEYQKELEGLYGIKAEADGLAAAIAKGEAPVNRCPVGGEPVGKIIAGIMGQAAVETARQVAHVKCSGTCEKAKEEYVYTGVEDCEMLPFVPNGGAKSCTYGCCGFGSCVKVCPFDAIHIVDGIAVVDKEACKACGKCVAKCPRHLIELIPYDQKVAVDCSSHDKGKQVMAACEIGCIGCKKCEKTCPNGAITVEDFCAHIDYEKCTGCGACKEACPRGVIREA